MILENYYTHLRQFYGRRDSILIEGFCILTTLFIFLGYDKPWILPIWLLFGIYFYKTWTDPDKPVWLTIFFKLTFWMILAENAVILATNALQYNYMNIFYKVPHWLPMAYANSLLFIILNYRFYQYANPKVSAQK